ncbi:MAG: SIR2 family protein [Thioalkalivibrio sp.]|nr:SIR2 family protein [Thioalkalivibrio sp.]
MEAAEGVRKIHNYWAAFGALQRELGKTTFGAEVRRALSGAETATIPEAYRMLWRLPIQGMLTLNLDRLPARAFSEQYGGRVVSEFNSKSVGAYTHALNAPQPFIYNVHGVLGDRSSWVFTDRELQALTRTAAYQNFIRSTLSTRTVLFVGISAEDVAAGGHLDRLTSKGIQTGTHYWITERADHNTDEWAEAAGIQVIRYRTHGGSHSELNELFQDLVSYIPREDPEAPPVTSSQQLPPAVLPDPDKLMSEDAETIRRLLNRQAMEILTEESHASYSRYEEFSAEYDEAIHRAWYTSTKPGRNLLLGYELEKEEAQGAFGRVFRARRPNGDPVAIKVLLNEIRSNSEMLHSFRRGVRSMRILSENGVEGMVPYHEASEIPAFVVMDWVNGANLKQAVEARQLSGWRDILKVAIDISDIIRRAHALPQRVLHRDLRPANIMLEDFWSGDPWKVVLLDFDLSWHKGAADKSVMHTTSTAGYLAPEQIEKVRGVSSRHGAVDSFGLGMTFYFILSGRDPLPAEHRHSNWATTVHEACAAHGDPLWVSIPSRFARLILAATADRQTDRWDVTQIWGELTRLAGALDSPRHVEAADMLAEEVAARCQLGSFYRWEEDRDTAVYQSPTGVTIEVSGSITERQIGLRIAWQTGGEHERRGLGKRTGQAAEAAGAILSSANWVIRTQTGGGNAVFVSGEVSSERVSANIDRFAQSIDRVMEVLRFEGSRGS